MSVSVEGVTSQSGANRHTSIPPRLNSDALHFSGRDRSYSHDDYPDHLHRDRHVDVEQAFFTEEFLRQREASALCDVVKDVRALMQRCRLPSMDVAAVEKYVIRIVERGRPRPSPNSYSNHGSRTHPEESEPPAKEPRNGLGYSPTTTDAPVGVNVSSSGANSPTASHPIPHRPHSVPSGPAGMPFGVHSRHAAWYAAFLRTEKPSRRTQNGRRRRLLLRAHIAKDTSVVATPTCASNGASMEPHPPRRALSAGAGRIRRVETNEKAPRAISTPSSEGILRFEAAMTDLLQLHKVLHEHEVATLAVLVAIDRRQLILLRLQSFLKLTARRLLLLRHATNDNASHPPIISSPSKETRGRHPPTPNGHARGPRKLSSVDGGSQERVNDQRDSSLVPKSPESLERAVQPHRGAFRRRMYAHTPKETANPHYDTPHAWTLFFRRGVLYFLHHLQRASLAVVEAIAAWRRPLSGPHPFVVDGRNYQLVMLEQMAALSREEVMHRLFHSHTAPVGVDGAAKGVELADALRQFPLLTFLPRLSTHARPPSTPASLQADAPRFDVGAAPLFFPLEKRRVGAERRPMEVTISRRLRAAERRMRAEVETQLELLRTQLERCREGRYALLLRGVAELNGASDGTVQLESKELRQEWFGQLKDTLRRLEKGNSDLIGN